MSNYQFKGCDWLIIFCVFIYRLQFIQKAFQSFQCICQVLLKVKKIIIQSWRLCDIYREKNSSIVKLIPTIAQQCQRLRSNHSDVRMQIAGLNSEMSPLFQSLKSHMQKTETASVQGNMNSLFIWRFFLRIWNTKIIFFTPDELWNCSENSSFLFSKMALLNAVVEWRDYLWFLFVFRNRQIKTR